MSSEKLIRWSGMALMLGGVTLAFHYLTHPPVETIRYGLDPLFVVCHVVGGIAYMLIPLGLVGLYLRQEDKIALPGLLGFVLMYAACILLAGSQIFASVLVPFLAIKGQTWVDFPHGELFASPILQSYVSLDVLAHLVGLLLIGSATLRANILPRWASWVVISTSPIGAVCVFLFFSVSTGPLVQRLAQTGFGSLLGAGLVGWGWALWSEHANAPARQPKKKSSVTAGA